MQLMEHGSWLHGPNKVMMPMNVWCRWIIRIDTMAIRMSVISFIVMEINKRIGMNHHIPVLNHLVLLMVGRGMLKELIKYASIGKRKQILNVQH